MAALEFDLAKGEPALEEAAAAAALQSQVKRVWTQKSLDLSADCYDELRAASQHSRLGAVRLLLELGQQVPDQAGPSSDWVEDHGWKMLYRIGQPYVPSGGSKAAPAPGSQGCATGPRAPVWEVYAAIPSGNEASAEITALAEDLSSAARDAPVRGMLRCSARMLSVLSEVSVPPKEQFFWRLSEEEDGLFAAQGPFIVLGRSGTGKTQTMLYRMLLMSQKGIPPKMLFVTHSETLPGKVREHYSHLRWQGTPPEGFDVDVQGSERPIEVESKLSQGPVFASFPAMMRLFDSWSLQPFLRGGDFVDLHVFEDVFWPKINKTVQAVSVTPAEAWQEIMTVIKGSIVDSGTSGHIDRRKYMEKVESSILQKESQRKEAWAIFELYENLKNKSSFSSGWDRCDLAQSILSWQDAYSRAYSVNSNDIVLFDHIFIDEVQDLTQTELAVIFRFAKDPNNVILAGDTCQTVSAGINFRFAELRSTFNSHRKLISSEAGGADSSEPLHLYHLSTNYRSQSGVVQLSNSVLKWLGDLFPFSMDVLQPARGLTGGPMPVVHVCPGALDDFLGSIPSSTDSMLQQTALGATQAVLVANELAKKRLPPHLQNSIVLTVSESKGLEFDDVILLDFFADTSHLEWNLVLLEGERLAKVDVYNKNRAKTCTGLKLFYVAVTRAKRGLLILERSEHEPVAIKQLLKTEVLQAGLHSGAGKHFLEGLKSRAEQVQSIADWISVGRRLRARRLLEPAMRCFNLAGDAGKRDAQHCLALRDFIEGSYSEAARQFQALELWEMTANCFFKKHEFKTAAEYFLKADKLFDAAQSLRAAEQFDEAQVLYKKAGAHGLAFETYLQKICTSSRRLTQGDRSHAEFVFNPGLECILQDAGDIDHLKVLVAPLEQWNAVHLALRYACFSLAWELVHIENSVSDEVDRLPTSYFEDEVGQAWLKFQIKRAEVRECLPPSDDSKVSKRGELAIESHHLLITFFELRRARGFHICDYRQLASWHRALDYILEFCDNAGEDVVYERPRCWISNWSATSPEPGNKARLLHPGSSWRTEARLLVDAAAFIGEGSLPRPWGRSLDAKLYNLKRELWLVCINSADDFQQIQLGGTFSETMDVHHEDAAHLNLVDKNGREIGIGYEHRVGRLLVNATSVQHRSMAERLGLEVGLYSIVSMTHKDECDHDQMPYNKRKFKCLNRQFDLGLWKDLKRESVEKDLKDDEKIISYNDNYWARGVLHLRLLSEGQSTCKAPEIKPAEKSDTVEAAASGSSLKPSFETWIKDALIEEVGEVDAESLLCSIEVLLLDVQESELDEKLSSAAEVLTLCGAERTAARLAEAWHQC